MNLVTDRWIPVRPFSGAGPTKISLRDLLCGETKWELSLPRDDMELAALQLLICITQVILMPKDAAKLRGRIAEPLEDGKFDKAIVPFDDWFQLDHPKFPFMQVRGVAAKDPTSMDKLMAGLTGTTNCCFVNERGLAEQLCGGCTSIALFNLGSCSPSFGGGFKPGLRGPAAPLTTLLQGRHLRETVWLNVINQEEIERLMPWFKETHQQEPTWVKPIKAGENIKAQRIGLTRGLFWQPACLELQPAAGTGVCACCNSQKEQVYTLFNRAKFKYTIEGTWPHPHSPIITTNRKGNLQEKFASFGTSAAPSWTQLSRIVVQQQIDQLNNEGHQPAGVVQQARKLYGQQAKRLHLIVGGYLNRAGQASVMGRRHEVFTLNHGWDQYLDVIKEIVSLGIGYKSALTGGLFLFCKGRKDNKTDKVKIKGLGEKIELTRVAEAQFYRRSEPIIEDTLARIDFADVEPTLSRMRKVLRNIVEVLFNDSVRPYLNDPELVRTLAIARRTLRKHLKNLEPHQDKGGNNGTTKTP